MATCKCKVVPMALEHVEYLSTRLRTIDNMECLATSGRTAAESLRKGFEESLLSWTGMINGEPVMGFGVNCRGVLRHTGTAWMLASDKIQKVKVAVLRGSIEYRDKMLESFHCIENYVDERNTLSIMWLKWLGFNIEPPKPYGRNGERFCRFSLVKKEVSSNV